MAAKPKHTRTVFTLLLSSVLMFGFGFALVPLYDVFCRVTGLNGKVELVSVHPDELGAVDRGRQIKLQLVATNNETMPWLFKPQNSIVKLAPGEMYRTSYIARNQTTDFMIAQAVPSVSPSEAAPYLQKINCFCFERQPLKAQEEKAMPLVLSVAPELPDHIHTITLSYTLFDITPDRAAIAALGEGSLR
ncbi:MAG: cytochrome c oxidase assembly protein [Neptuniibacter sp.]